jgi:hypothetical protein
MHRASSQALIDLYRKYVPMSCIKLSDQLKIKHKKGKKKYIYSSSSILNETILIKIIFLLVLLKKKDFSFKSEP